jgi:DNA-binding response OmpR family regulator
MQMEQRPDKGRQQSRVLIVEDDADSLALLGKFLSQISLDGIPTATCAAARYAFETLGSCDIVIADAHLPDGDGVDLVQSLKRRYSCATAITSGDDMPVDGLPEGVDLWLVKPISFEHLTRAVAKLIDDRPMSEPVPAAT